MKLQHFAVALGLAASFAILPVSALAQDFNVEKFNMKMKADGADLKVIKVIPLLNGMNYVFAGNKESAQYGALITDDNQELAFAVAGVIPMGNEGKLLSEKIKVFTTEFQESLASESSGVVNQIFQKMSKENVFFFGGAKETDKNVDVFLIDPNCSFCKKEVNTTLTKLAADKIPFVVIPVAILGDDSVAKVSRLFMDKKMIDGKFENFKNSFLLEDSPTESQKALSLKATENTELLMSSKVITGVPYRFKTK